MQDRGQRWRRLARPTAIAAALALLLQVALPPADGFLRSPERLLALGSICHAATGDDGNRAPQPLSGHECDHCLLCQAGPAVFLPPPPDALPSLPAPAAISPAHMPPDNDRRGVTRPAYASRAPPTIG